MDATARPFPSYRLRRKLHGPFSYAAGRGRRSREQLRRGEAGAVRRGRRRERGRPGAADEDGNAEAEDLGSLLEFGLVWVTTIFMYTTQISEWVLYFRFYCWRQSK